MIRQYAFFVDSDACSGCRTCQVACKDAHDLRAGLSWRRVFEVTAGGWQRRHGAWVADVAAYYLSVACHHCQTPVCAQQCATDAIGKRPDGVVLIDDSRCTKCRKCEHDCPYGAIRWDSAAGVPRKCTFCVDRLDAGQAPVCVTACPNRALGYGEREDLARRPGTTSQVFPLPDAALAGPALVVAPHRRAAEMADRAPAVANWEEV